MSKVQSIRAKLLHIAKQNGVSHQMILTRFFYERLLYRISVSDYKENLLLKGGNLLFAIQGLTARPTIDIDFLGKHLTNEAEKIKAVFEEILSVKTEDNLIFDTEQLTAVPIDEQNHYTGIRVKVLVSLGNIKQYLQMDIGYGDLVTPKPMIIEYPILLTDFQVPLISAYTPETVIAEKLQAIISLAQLNSRMKDFYDIYTLLKTQELNNDILKEAITQTFNQRNTALNFETVVFTEEFYNDANRLKMWKAFLNKINVTEISFEEVVNSIENKLNEINLSK